MTRPIRVAAGILVANDGRVLLSERLGDSPFRGMWEFPGGKLGPGESAEAAMCRELHEELGIDVLSNRHFMNVRHDYADRAVDLTFYLVTEWQGEPRGLDGQKLSWQRPADIAPASVLPADEPVLVALRAAV